MSTVMKALGRGPSLPRDVEGLLEATRRAAGGDEGPLWAWWRDRNPLMVRACVTWAGYALGEEVAARLMVTAFHRVEDGIRAPSERAWLCVAASLERRKILEFDARSGAEFPDGIAGPWRDPVEEATEQEERDLFRAAILALPIKYAATLWLHYVVGATEAQVADWVQTKWTGVGRAETHRILGNGREMLKASLKGEDPRRRWPRRYSEKRSRWNAIPPPLFPGLTEWPPGVPAARVPEE